MKPGNQESSQDRKLSKIGNSVLKHQVSRPYSLGFNIMYNAWVLPVNTQVDQDNLIGNSSQALVKFCSKRDVQGNQEGKVSRISALLAWPVDQVQI